MLIKSPCTFGSGNCPPMDFDRYPTLIRRVFRKVAKFLRFFLSVKFHTCYTKTFCFPGTIPKVPGLFNPIVYPNLEIFFPFGP